MPQTPERRRQIRAFNRAHGISARGTPLLSVPHAGTTVPRYHGTAHLVPHEGDTLESAEHRNHSVPQAGTTSGYCARASHDEVIEAAEWRDVSPPRPEALKVTGLGLALGFARLAESAMRQRAQAAPRALVQAQRPAPGAMPTRSSTTRLMLAGPVAAVAPVIVKPHAPALPRPPRQAPVDWWQAALTSIGVAPQAPEASQILTDLNQTRPQIADRMPRGHRSTRMLQKAITRSETCFAHRLGLRRSPPPEHRQPGRNSPCSLRLLHC